MSHFPLIVIGGDVDEQLAPFDENISVEPYVDEADTDWKSKVDDARAYYTTKAQPPVDVSGWSDAKILSEYTGDAWKPAKAREGFERWSTYNPLSKWDWWVTGGRWDSVYQTRDGRRVNEFTIGEVDIDSLKVPHAVLKDGQWHQAGRMGWFGIVLEEKDAWEDEFRALLRGLPADTVLTVVDCHI